MKIAIMTQTLGHNYGGIMQAWALQQVLKRDGHQVVTLNRLSDSRSFPHAIARKLKRGLTETIGVRPLPNSIESNLPSQLLAARMLTNTRKFIKSELSMSEPLDSEAKLRKHIKSHGYEAVIVGSDQTWRPMYSPKLSNFFLDFLEDTNIKRIAYATSFGSDQWEYTQEEAERYGALAKKFDTVTVREDLAVEMCQTHFGITPEHVVDPTLLLNAEDYRALIGKDRLSDINGGVYTYFLNPDDEKRNLANHASEQLNEPVFTHKPLYDTLDKMFAAGGNISEARLPEIRDWLAGFANASFVLTDSFHGMVFSLIFNKPFLVVNNPERGVARINSLATASDRHSSIWDNTSEVDFMALAKQDTVNSLKFNEMRSSSHKTLRLALSGTRENSTSEKQRHSDHGLTQTATT